MNKEKPKGLPITVKDLENTFLQESFTNLYATILFNKTKIVKNKLIEVLDIKESQFETIIRKEASKITVRVLPSSGNPNQVLKERYYFEGKYIFTLLIIIRSTVDINSTLNIFYDTSKEDNIISLEEESKLDKETTLESIHNAVNKEKDKIINNAGK